MNDERKPTSSDTENPSLITVSIIVHDDFAHVATLLSTVVANPRCKVFVTFNKRITSEAETLQQHFPTVSYLINTSPRGFAANHNTVLRTAETPFVALLNDDIMFSDTLIDEMVDYLQQNQDVGIATPRIVRADGSPHVTSFQDPSLLRMIFRISGLGALTPYGGLLRRLIARLGLLYRLGAASTAQSTDIYRAPVVIGVAMFVRRAAYEQAGLMDEDTRFYGEEFGWQLRMRRAGWHAAVVGTVSAVHFNASQDLSGWKLAEHRKSILNYFIKYRPAWQARLLRLVIFFVHGLRALIIRPFAGDEASANWQAAQIAWWNPEPK